MSCKPPSGLADSVEQFVALVEQGLIPAAETVIAFLTLPASRLLGSRCWGRNHAPAC